MAKVVTYINTVDEDDVLQTEETMSPRSIVEAISEIDPDDLEDVISGLTVEFRRITGQEPREQ